MGRQQVAALRAKQKVEMEAKAREVVAIKLQAAWRGRQGRMRVSVTCPRLDGCHTGARACVTCQAHTNHVATTGQETASRAGPEAERNRGGARHPGCVRRVMQGAVVVDPGAHSLNAAPCRFRRQRTNRRIAARRAAMDEANRRAEAEANALDSLRRMGARGNPPSGQARLHCATSLCLHSCAM